MQFVFFVVTKLPAEPAVIDRRYSDSENKIENRESKLENFAAPKV